MREAEGFLGCGGLSAPWRRTVRRPNPENRQRQEVLAVTVLDTGRLSAARCRTVRRSSSSADRAAGAPVQCRLSTTDFPAMYGGLSASPEFEPNG